MRSKLLLAATCAALATGCPPPQIDPGACGDLSTDKVTRKLHAFLAASADLDRATAELETSVHDACVRMAVELGVATDGDTRTVCKRAADELQANLQVSVSQEQRLVTRYVPPVCTSQIEFTAGLVAECEASVAAEVACAARAPAAGPATARATARARPPAPNGQCAGTCDGTCNGSCSGTCAGYTSVEASAECRASAEIQTSIHTECSEPRVEVVRETVTVVDDSKFQRASAAIAAGMPTLLRVGAQAELVGKALVHWVETGAGLIKASGQLVGQLGERGLCVGTQLAATVAAVADIQARVSISIDVSVQVSAAAGAQAQ
jgi:hypothetical protein